MKFTKRHEELIDKLQELCPTAFSKKPASKLPLALGSTKAVQAILDVNYATAEYLLKLWCQGRRYDKACSVAGTPRYHVNGSVAGKVSAGQAEFHKARLEKFYRSRAVGAAKYYSGNLAEFYAAKFETGKPWNTKEEQRNA